MELATQLKAGMAITAGADDEAGRSGDIIDLWSPIVGARQPFYSVDETAAIMRVSSCTIRAMIRDGRLQASRFGGRVLIEALSIRLALEPIQPSTQQDSEQGTDGSNHHSTEAAGGDSPTR